MTNEKEFKIFCPNCGQCLSYDSTMFDQVFQCPACGKEVKTPSMPVPEPAPVVIKVVRRGNGGEKRKRLLRAVGIASAAVVVVTILAALGYRLSQEEDTSTASSYHSKGTQWMSASSLCKELVGNNTEYTFVDDHTVTWRDLNINFFDVEADCTKLQCIASFSNDGTVTLVQDNTAFAQEFSRIPKEMLGRLLEEEFSFAFAMANIAEPKIVPFTTEVRDGHLYFGGTIQVEPGNVRDKINNLLCSLLTARNIVRSRLLSQ